MGFPHHKARSRRHLCDACLGARGLSCSGSGEHQAHSAVCSHPHPHPPTPLLTTGSTNPARTDSICQRQSLSSFLKFDLLRQKCAKTLNTVCFPIILRSSRAARERSGSSQLQTSFLWTVPETLPAASLLIDLFSQIGNQKCPEGDRSFTVPEDKPTSSPFLLEALAGEVVCQRQIPLGALLDLGVSSTVHGAHFPELHSFTVSESIQREKRAASLPHSAAQAPNLGWNSPQWERKTDPRTKLQSVKQRQQDRGHGEHDSSVCECPTPSSATFPWHCCADHELMCHLLFLNFILLFNNKLLWLVPVSLTDSSTNVCTAPDKDTNMSVMYYCFHLVLKAHHWSCLMSTHLILFMDAPSQQMDISFAFRASLVWIQLKWVSLEKSDGSLNSFETVNLGNIFVISLNDNINMNSFIVYYSILTVYLSIKYKHRSVKGVFMIHFCYVQLQEKSVLPATFFFAFSINICFAPATV